MSDSARPCPLFVLLLLSACSIADESLVTLGTSPNRRMSVGPAYSLVCWNTHKVEWPDLDQPAGEDRESPVGKLIRELDPDILCLQEVVDDTPMDRSLCREDVEAWQFQAGFARSFHWSWKDGYNGVLTASRFQVADFAALRSEGRELFFIIPKAALITRLPLEDERVLTVVNVHGLNFTPAGTLARQLEAIEDRLSQDTGPMIACGDFNTWNGQRIKEVQQFAARLGLAEYIPVHDDDSGTPPDRYILLNPIIDLFTDLDTDMTLDRVFCRGLNVLECRRLPEYTGPDVDHSPIRVEFRLAPPDDRTGRD